MQKKTYLQQSLQKGKVVRWGMGANTQGSLSLKVYIAPFRFYSKADEDYKYREMVMRALDTWHKASGGKIVFTIITSLMSSQINIDWKRVDRQALGYCHFNTDSQNRLFSAEVQIGISDGIIHQQYMAEDEVYHTILHEIGHALGLGHSPYETDIMFSPHKYGVVNLSEKDKLTLQWLYKMPLGMTPHEIGSKYGFHTDDLDEIVLKLIEKKEPSEFEKVKESLQPPERDLLQEAENIADLKKYNLALQNITISDDIRKIIINKPSSQH